MTESRAAEPAPSVLSVEKIWAQAPHNAFTDLIRCRDTWLCCFLEAGDHVSDAGRVRILASADGATWRSAALVAEEGVDLRDPKLFRMPDGRLMLLMGGTHAGPPAAPGRQPRAAFSLDGTAWSAPRRFLRKGDWLWRVTWRDGRVYGVSYRLGWGGKWTVTLLESADGLDFRSLCRLRVPGKPNESTIGFKDDGEAVAMVRREGGNRKGWIGRSRPPYNRWKWQETGHRFGGPNFIILPDGSMWAASRLYREDGYGTAIARLDEHGYTPVLELPSGGDCGYPGLAWHAGLLWVSYYSTHEGKTGIYLARVKIPPSYR